MGLQSENASVDAPTSGGRIIIATGLPLDRHLALEDWSSRFFSLAMHIVREAVELGLPAEEDRTYWRLARFAPSANSLAGNVTTLLEGLHAFRTVMACNNGLLHDVSCLGDVAKFAAGFRDALADAIDEAYTLHHVLLGDGKTSREADEALEYAVDGLKARLALLSLPGEHGADRTLRQLRAAIAPLEFLVDEADLGKVAEVTLAADTDEVREYLVAGIRTLRTFGDSIHQTAVTDTIDGTGRVTEETLANLANRPGIELHAYAPRPDELRLTLTLQYGLLDVSLDERFAKQWARAIEALKAHRPELSRIVLLNTPALAWARGDNATGVSLRFAVKAVDAPVDGPRAPDGETYLCAKADYLLGRRRPLQAESANLPSRRFEIATARELLTDPAQLPAYENVAARIDFIAGVLNRSVPRDPPGIETHIRAVIDSRPTWGMRNGDPWDTGAFAVSFYRRDSDGEDWASTTGKHAAVIVDRLTSFTGLPIEGFSPGGINELLATLPGRAFLSANTAKLLGALSRYRIGLLEFPIDDHVVNHDIDPVLTAIYRLIPPSSLAANGSMLEVMPAGRSGLMGTSMTRTPQLSVNVRSDHHYLFLGVYKPTDTALEGGLVHWRECHPMLAQLGDHVITGALRAVTNAAVERPITRRFVGETLERAGLLLPEDLVASLAAEVRNLAPEFVSARDINLLFVSFVEKTPCALWCENGRWVVCTVDEIPKGKTEAQLAMIPLT